MKSEHGIGIFALIFCLFVLAVFIAFSIYIIRLDNIVRDKFEGQRWDIPAKVFARPLEIYPNAPITLSDLNEELKLLGYTSSDSYAKPGSYVVTGSTYYIHTRGFDFGDRVEPEQVLKINIQQDSIAEVSTTKPSTNGVARLEPLLIGGIYPQHNEDRVLTKLNKVPRPLVEALIATEDRNFYTHHGISVRGTARALLANVTGGKRQGGSTLTQQLVKNFYLSPERTLKRKVNEALMAILVELHYSKEEILEAYLNEVNLGQNGNYSINGYGLASQFYFGLPLRELNTSQQAFLVGLVQGPSLYNPWRNPEAATKRRDIVLNNMLVMGNLSQEQYEKEIARPLNTIVKPTLGPARYPDYLDIVRRQLRTEFQESDLTNQGLRIFTALDPIAQTKIQNAFKDAVANLAKTNKRRLEDLQGAVLISRPENGELVAAVGSTQDFTGFNRALDAKRQVGSLLKPIIYLNALQSNRYNWATQIEDSPITIPSNGKNWTPKNYSGTEHGVIPMAQALAQSYNLSAVRLGQEFGLSTFINQLKRFGVNSPIPEYPSIYLGAVNMSPLEVMNIYGNFASGGYARPTKAIRAVVDANGRLLDRYSLAEQSTITPDMAYLLNYGLQQVMSTGTGRSAYAQLPNTLKLAGKSGTTNDTRDSWFAGYTGNYLSVVWLGLDDNSITGLTGSSGALPVWTHVMKQLRLKAVDLRQPENVAWYWVDRHTGALSHQNCEGAIQIPIQQKAIPRAMSPCASAIEERTQLQNLLDPQNPPEDSDNPNQPYIQESEPESDGIDRLISSGGFSST